MKKTYWQFYQRRWRLLHDNYPLSHVLHEAIDWAAVFAVLLLSPVLILFGAARDYWRQQQQ